MSNLKINISILPRVHSDVEVAVVSINLMAIIPLKLLEIVSQEGIMKYFGQFEGSKRLDFTEE